jgi:hypothetical protein
MGTRPSSLPIRPLSRPARLGLGFTEMFTPPLPIERTLAVVPSAQLTVTSVGE